MGKIDLKHLDKYSNEDDNRTFKNNYVPIKSKKNIKEVNKTKKK
jgi:hypothetical protein